MNERNKLKKIVILMVAGVLLCTFVMAMDIFTPSSTTTGSPAAIERTYIANGTQNVTVTGDAAFIVGYSAGIGLYVTLPTNVSGPMITPFEVNVTAYGQAVESLYRCHLVLAVQVSSVHLIAILRTSSLPPCIALPHCLLYPRLLPFFSQIL